jgi:cytochrome c biogenesis protein CcmG/thiol:disulfide interchange protein DsbE
MSQISHPPGPPAAPDPSGQGEGAAAGGSGLIRVIAMAAFLAVGLAMILQGESVPVQLTRGVEAPAFELPLLGDSQIVSLADQRGKVVLVNFWATWCKPCEEEIPSMGRLYDRFDRADFEMLAISVDEDAEPVEEFRSRLGIDFPILMDPTQQTSRLYQTMGFPESLLVDRDGVVVERYVGPRDWDHPSYEKRIRNLITGG